MQTERGDRDRHAESGVRGEERDKQVESGARETDMQR